ncbi:hypothetical protein ACFOWX_00920 [Sphingorhabdus arenilitoris]|uniref:Apea-like HEPN domain-containing protein n=1 Tax=Sphingorhabdus arenilitoris TaxID=1490041 RepID=A0ABV8RCA6_9SPHN
MTNPKYPPPKDSSDWPEALIQDYHTIFGEFLQTYATVESGLLFLIDRYAGGLLADDINSGTPPSEVWGRTKVQMDIVRALVGSKRSDQISETIKLLFRVAKRSNDDQEFVNDALSQFSHIRFMRDRLVHSGSTPFYDNGWFFHTANSLEVKERVKARDYVFKLHDLKNMTTDLISIRLRLAAATVNDNPGIVALAKEHNAFQPWLYKQVQPVDPDHTQKRIRESHHPLPQSPLGAALSIAMSYPVTDGGPLMYAGERRTDAGG